MHYLQGDTRDQLFTTSLEDGIESDNTVRLIDLLINMILKQMSADDFPKGKSNVGRKAFSSSHMLKLYIYGYMNKIQSSRKLEKECLRNLELKWLINNLTPDYKTIADFRRDNSQLINFVTLAFRKMLLSAGQALGQVLVLDGTKFKANASREALDHKTITELLNKAKQDHLRYYTFLQAADIQEDTDSLEEENLNLETMRERLAVLEQKIAHYEQMKKLSEIDKKRRVSIVDPESRLVTSQGQKSYNGYNVQALVDEFNKLILCAFVSDSAVDTHQMIPALDTVKNELNLEPAVLIADNGYLATTDLQKVENDYHTETYVSVGTEESRKMRNKKLTKQNFIFEEENNRYKCPQGHYLTARTGLHKIKDRMGITYCCHDKYCRECPYRPQCTDSKEGRKITRYSDEKWVEDYHVKMQSSVAQAVLKKRKTIIEHVFGVIKCWMGKIPLLLRGKRKVQTEINLYTTAYNMKRLTKIMSFDKIVDMILGKTQTCRRLYIDYRLYQSRIRWFDKLKYQN